jgi:hypothetical protein
MPRRRCRRRRARCHVRSRQTFPHSGVPTSSAPRRSACDSFRSCGRSRRTPGVPGRTIAGRSNRTNRRPAGYPARQRGRPGCTRTSTPWRDSPRRLWEGRGWTRADALSRWGRMDRARRLFPPSGPGCPSRSIGSARSALCRCRFRAERAGSPTCDIRPARRGTWSPSTARLHSAIASQTRHPPQTRLSSGWCSEQLSLTAVPAVPRIERRRRPTRTSRRAQDLYHIAKRKRAAIVRPPPDC